MWNQTTTKRRPGPTKAPRGRFRNDISAYSWDLTCPLRLDTAGHPGLPNRPGKQTAFWCREKRNCESGLAVRFRPDNYSVRKCPYHSVAGHYSRNKRSCICRLSGRTHSRCYLAEFRVGVYLSMEKGHLSMHRSN